MAGVEQTPSRDSIRDAQAAGTALPTSIGKLLHSVYHDAPWVHSLSPVVAKGYIEGLNSLGVASLLWSHVPRDTELGQLQGAVIVGGPSSGTPNEKSWMCSVIPLTPSLA